MRLRVLLDNPQETAIPINYQAYLTAVVYHLLGTSDSEYSRFLHDDGYAHDGEPQRRFKLFTFSGLRVAKHRRRIQGDTLWLTPGPIEWLISSPLEPFLTHLATGLLSSDSLRIGPAAFLLRGVETLPTPAFVPSPSQAEGRGEVRFTCLTPIVAAVSLPDGGTRYLRPRGDGDQFSDVVRRNLLRKHQILHGHPPADDRFHLTFDADYLARDKNGGTKKITYKEIEIVGAQAPFTVTGSPELMRIGWECGMGEKNAAGFGMVEVGA